MKIKKINNAVYQSEKKLSSFDIKDIKFLKKNLSNSPLMRNRICVHKNISDNIHEMLIVLDKKTYIRPDKHLNKSESLLVIDGHADAIFFNEDGTIKEVLKLGAYNSGDIFYYRMDEPIYHTLLIRSDVFIFKEVTKGPLIESDTISASWSPSEKKTALAQEYQKKLSTQVQNFKHK